MDSTTGKQYPIRSFVFFRSDAYVNSKLNLGVLADSLRKSKDIFLIGDRIIVALATDFSAHSEHNFYVDRPAFPGYEEKRVEQFLQQNNIQYHSVPDLLPGEALSPDKRFIAREDGIYLAETNQRVIDGYSTSKYYRSYSRKYFSVRGWIYDSSGVIYSKFLEPCLIEIEPFFIDATQCYVGVPQPLIELKVPKKYLLPTQNH